MVMIANRPLKGAVGMRRIALLAILIMSSKSLIAGEMGSIQMDSSADFKGSYLGVGVGGFFPLYDTQVNTLITARLPYLAAVNGNGDLSSNNVFGDVFLGYGFLFNSFYLGPEVYFSAGSRPQADFSIQALDSFPNELLSTDTMTKLNLWEAGIDARLGWVATPGSLLFVRLGAAFNNMRLYSNTTTYTNGTVVPQTKLIDYSVSKSLVGFRAGVGIEQKLTPRVSVRADYVYTYYGTILTNGLNYNLPLGPIINTTRVHLQSQAVMGSIIYNFSV